MNTSTRIALVTGATRGIGHETVRQLADAGVHTILAGRDRDRPLDGTHACAQLVRVDAAGPKGGHFHHDQALAW